MKRIILAAFVALSLVACQVNYEKTPSGITYKIFNGSGGDTAKAGQIVKFNLEILLTGRTGKADSVLTSTIGKIPAYNQVDTSARALGSFMEILPKLRTGDSAIINISVDTLKSKGAINPQDSIVFTKGSSIQFKLKILSVFKTQDEAMAAYQKDMDGANAKEIKLVEDYMAQKGIKGIKTKSGAYVSIENPGDTSMKADSGTLSTIKYKGYLQDNGKVFDSSASDSEGYPVRVGTHSVIQGWDEALPYFGNGGSGKILVPAFLGYGAQGNGPDLPPNANLVFEIKVVKVEPAPPMPADDGGPQIMPQ